MGQPAHGISKVIYANQKKCSDVFPQIFTVVRHRIVCEFLQALYFRLVRFAL
jgi:hypothetical protein